ncbi:hypothetical protein OVY01_17455 [Robbsia sp. Bb-Pol-6]|uniref:Uncharacterized protein n=2 Tax=Robbsia betulipollinis TaxID=2981849 RepID=A0ABT3ZQX7_9BURK|nr:hypothetical protein [Robbsia betulipollinis]
MSALSFSATIGLVADTFAINILNKSDSLNRFVSWITHARVNRETLAQRVWHSAIGLLQDSQIVSKSLGARGATLAPLLTTALIKGDHEEMRQAVAELTRIGVDGAIGTATMHGAKRALAMVLGEATSMVSTKLIDSYLGTHAGEKVLATMVARHGWTPIQERLQKALGASVGSGFLIGQIKGVLDTAVIKKTGMNQETSAEYRTLADLAHIGLTGGGHDAMLARLQDYAPTSFAAVQLASSSWQAVQTFAESVATRVNEARVTVNDTARLVKETVPALLHTIQTQAGLGLQPQSLDDAYAASAHAVHTGKASAVGSMPFAVDVKDRQIADAYLTRLAIARTAEHQVSDAFGLVPADAPLIAAARVRQDLFEVAQETPERFNDTQRLLDILSPQQLSPLGERGDIAVVKTLTGQLAKIEANSHRWLKNDVELNDAIENTLAQLPDDTTWLGGYKVGRAFATHFDVSNISLPASEYGYADGARDGGMAIANVGWGLLGFKADSLSADANARLRHLYNTCGQDAGVMQEATRYLDPRSAQSMMASTVLAQFATADRSPPLIDTGDGFVQLAGEDPRINFKVTRNADMVTLSMEARWSVTGFGVTSDAMREPLDAAKDSAMSTACTITIRRRPDGEGLDVRRIAMGTAVTIANTIDFDAGSGRLVSSSA